MCISDRIRKEKIRIFKNGGFKIDIETNLHLVDFLDLTFDLLDGTYKAYKKSNDQVFYVNASTNHPSRVIKQLPTLISDRLSNNSSNTQIFSLSKGEKVLKKTVTKMFV